MRMKAGGTSRLVGFCLLAVIAVAFSSVFLLQKQHSNELLTPLRLVFEGSVSGLRSGRDVTFNGIKIGEVRSVKLDNPQRIVALTMISKLAPIRRDTIVTLKLQGLSGIVAVALEGGAGDASPVDQDEDGTPLLTAQVRGVQDISQSVQMTKENIVRLVDDNREAVKNTFANIEAFRDILAENSDHWDSIYAKGQSLIGSNDKPGDRSNHFTEVLNRIPIDKITKEMSRSVASFKELSSNFDKRSAALLADKLQMQADVARAAANLDRNPSRLILGASGNQVAPATQPRP